MRLIDTDAEIKKIEAEIKNEYWKIERYKAYQAKEPYNSVYDFAEKIAQCYRNIIDCEKEICILKQYKTAYDVDMVVEELSVIEDMADYQMYLKAVEIVKRGGK